MATFDERAKDWDTPEHIERSVAVANAIAAAIPLGRSMRVIEIGAGTGLLGLQLADRIGSLLLTDPSAGMLEVADEKIRRAGLGQVATRRYELVTDPPPAGGFDLLLSQLMLHHVKDTAAALAAVHDLLVPGGQLALADLDAEDGTFHDAEAEGIHHHGFERDRLASIVAAAGLTGIAFATATSIERDGRDYPLFLLTARRPRD
ncbi:MAG TPA: class I SAM-dependent methyltransferase [Candidatus Limnocylindrales bacterium]|nr:class I SAM-dependent methyltransferase [Candidatus Limnocylindrales bacterium]